MPKSLFLICIKNPFEKKPFLFCKVDINSFFSREISSIKEYNEVYAFGFEELIDDIRSANHKIDKEIYDIVTAKKLITGKPKSTFNLGNEPWSLKNILGKDLNVHTMKWLDDLLQLKEIDPTNSHNLNELISSLMIAYEKSWDKIKLQLKDKGEEDRYFKLEVPIYKIFLQVQLNGIHVNQEKLEKKLLGLKKNYYTSLKWLELEYGFLSYDINSSLNLDKIKQYYHSDEIPNELTSDFWDYAKIMAEFDEPFFMNLVTARDSNDDYDALLRYNFDKYKKVYPQFDTMGTVTGRILVIRPGVQYLKKTSRAFFEPKDGNVFLYADFDQFEPGILAQLSSDNRLIELYNKGDIYANLSLLLFKSAEKRKIAKILFLAYSYGMKQENLEKLIFSISKDKEIVHQANIFFSEFTELRDWKSKVCDETRENGYAESIMGNRRYTASKNFLSDSEQRWVPNQIIQGTASVIFKKSLLSVNNKYPDIGILIPMHDAILVEVKQNKVEDAKRALTQELNENFQAVCPKIKTSISFENFF